MKVKDLKEILKTIDDESDVKVLLNEPSIGGVAYSEVTGSFVGFDWDSGLYLITKDSITSKPKSQDLLEEAHSLLMYLATADKNTYACRRAKIMLIKHGYSEEDLKKYKHLYHQKKKD